MTDDNYYKELDEYWAERLRPFSGLDFSKKYTFHLKDGSTTTQLGSWLLLEGCDPDEFEDGGYAVVDWDKADNIASFEPVNE